MHTVWLQLNLESLWLKEAGPGRSAFFPDTANEKFDFTADVGLFITRFIVEGTQSRLRPAVSASMACPSTSRISSLSNIQPPPVYKSNRASSGGPFANVKITYSIIKKSGSRPDFKKLHQAFIKVNDDTANVHYLTYMIRQKWNCDLVLVTPEGMPIEDGSGTQGNLHAVSMMHSLVLTWGDVYVCIYIY